MDDIASKLSFDVSDFQKNVLNTDLDYRIAAREVEVNKKILKRKLSKDQKKILNLILEEVDIVKAIVAKASFNQGFNVAMDLKDNLIQSQESSKDK